MMILIGEYVVAPAPILKLMNALVSHYETHQN